MKMCQNRNDELIVDIASFLSSGSGPMSSVSVGLSVHRMYVMYVPGLPDYIVITCEL